MDPKRITVDEVLAAYETLGVDRIRDCFWTCQERDGATTFCACPASVVAICRLPEPLKTLAMVKDGLEFASGLAQEEFGTYYLNAFVAGVDNSYSRPHEGYEDGLAVRAALWPEPANA